MMLAILTRVSVVTLALLALLSEPVLAQNQSPAQTLAQNPAKKPLRFCVFDPAGKAGNLYAQSKDYLDTVAHWAGPTEVRLYEDERIATEDFKAGQCDGVAISTLRARPFNTFVGSIDSIGSLPSAAHVRTLVGALANPKLQPYMEQGPYEVIGVVPLGAVYVMVRDRRINSIEKAAGRKVAVMDWDPSESQLVESLAAQPVASDVTTFAAKFNNGQVDVVVAPAVLFRQLELNRGLAHNGGIFRFPLAQLTATLLIRKDRFPAGFGQRFRAYVPSQLDGSFARIAAAESEIPAADWLELPPADVERYTQLMQIGREQLVQTGDYDPRMLALLKHVRCKLEPALAECSLASL